MFEFKYHRENAPKTVTVETKLAEAKTQIVNRHDGEEVDAAHRVRVAVVFDEVKRNFALWEEI